MILGSLPKFLYRFQFRLIFIILCDHMLVCVCVCVLGSKPFLLCICLFRCDSENLPSVVDPPQSQFKSRCMWGKLEISISHFDHTHTQSRRGGCSELSCLRSEGIFSVTSFITSELMKPIVCCTHMFFPAEV